MSAAGVAERWFLTRAERGNSDTAVDAGLGSGRAWTEGNLVRPLVHGATYFGRLCSELEQLGRGDSVWFADWRGDRDEMLKPSGPTVGQLLASLSARGVDVRGLVWRSHPSRLSFSEGPNRRLEEHINRHGGQVLLDQRVRPFGSHHQKMLLIRPRGRPDAAVAFLGGIDLSHSRRDDSNHEGDPQALRINRRYGPHPPWHDVQLEIRGPAVAQVEVGFRERWADPTPLDNPTPLRALLARMSSEPAAPSPLPPLLSPPAAVGPHAVQILRTYPRRRRHYPFARRGEFSIARALIKAIDQAERLIYIEDQYLWSTEVASTLAARLSSRPRLQLLAVVPRWPDVDGVLSGPPNRIGQLEAMGLLQQAGGSRVGIYDIENLRGCPTYVHAKVCIIDDVWALVGSDNFNLRSWTHDSELSCAVVDSRLDPRSPRDLGGRGDGAREFARNLRLELWAEHLGRQPSDPDLLDPEAASELWRQAAATVARWHAGGRRGPHPGERVARHTPVPVSPSSRWWVLPLYRTLYDPDGRSAAQRRLRRF